MRFLVVVCALLVMFMTWTHLKQESVTQPPNDYVLIIEEPSQETQEEQQGSPMVLLKSTEGTCELDLEQYLISVVMSEMPASFSQEALKAQAVAARTFASRMLLAGKHADFDVCSSASCCQAWMSETQLREKCADSFDSVRERACMAVAQTCGQVLTYQGELIDAVYYSCSGGFSEPAEAVWGAEIPYLQSVKSPGEEISSKYESQVRIPFRKFKSILQQENPNAWFSVIPEYWVGKTQRSAGGGVASMELGGVTFTGTKLRSLFSLNSTLFDLCVGNGEMIFSVKGYGHRVGMSQYGAEVMARAGKDYREILTHYYTGVTIKKLSRTGSGQFVFAET